MNTIERFRAAETSANRIIAAFIAGNDAKPDAVAERTEAIIASTAGMKKDEAVAFLAAQIVALEKPKNENKPKVEDIVKALLCDEDCAILPYESIAQLVHKAIPESNTSSKSVASYFSKKGVEWQAQKRVRLQINPLEAMAAATAVNQ